MESILFAGAVAGMLWLCFSIYKADKAKNIENNLGVFAFKMKKDVPPKAGFKK